MQSVLPYQTAAGLRPAADSMPLDDGVERRSAVRIELPFPATVRGVDATGERFELDTVLDNFSGDGLYLRLARPVEPGMKLFIVVRLSIAPAREADAARVALRGVVLRVEPQADGRCGVAVAFRHHRFLYLAAP